MDVGDVVRLKSGGPKMTVEHVGMFGARCVWFELTGELKRGEFELKMLKKEVPR